MIVFIYLSINHTKIIIFRFLLLSVNINIYSILNPIASYIIDSNVSLSTIDKISFGCNLIASNNFIPNSTANIIIFLTIFFIFFP